MHTLLFEGQCGLGSDPLTWRPRWANECEGVWMRRQPLAALGILSAPGSRPPPPVFGVVFMFAQLPPAARRSNCLLLPGPQFKHTLHWEIFCNPVIKFVLPRIQALKCQRPSPWLQACHMTPQGWGWLSPRLHLALSERLHHTKKIF